MKTLRVTIDIALHPDGEVGVEWTTSNLSEDADEQVKEQMIIYEAIEQALAVSREVKR